MEGFNSLGGGASQYHHRINATTQQQQLQLQQHHQPSNGIGQSSENYQVGNDHHMMMMMGGGGGGGSGGGGGGSVSCEDCGNQAKKDCVHMRCRTCCRSRGFHCPTHVKSTWVPASVRRERQLKLLHHQQAHNQPQLGGGDHHQQEADLPKRRRRRGSSAASSSLVCTQLPLASSSGMDQLGMNNYLPAEVSSAAVFRCVRVTSIDESKEEYAYQTAVSIGGHVFKGILYDQGPGTQGGGATSTYLYAAGGESDGGGANNNPAVAVNNNFGVGLTSAASTMVASSSSPVVGYSIDPSLYAVPLTSHMPHHQPGTHFFPNPPRP